MFQRSRLAVKLQNLVMMFGNAKDVLSQVIQFLAQIHTTAIKMIEFARWQDTLEYWKRMEDISELIKISANQLEFMVVSKMKLEPMIVLLIILIAVIKSIWSNHFERALNSNVIFQIEPR